MKQMALAAMNYESSNGTFPMGDQHGPGLAERGTDSPGFWPFLARRRFYEQGDMFNAWNSSVMLYEYPNITVNGVGITTLWCPSDGTSPAFDILDHKGTDGIVRPSR